MVQDKAPNTHRYHNVIDHRGPSWPSSSWLVEKKANLMKRAAQVESEIAHYIPRMRNSEGVSEGGKHGTPVTENPPRAGALQDSGVVCCDT